MRPSSTLLILVLFFSGFSYSPGQVQFKLAAEGGLHQFQEEQSNFIARLSGSVKYNHLFSRQFLRLQGRFSPEIIDTKNSVSSYKFSGRIETGRHEKSYGWDGYLRLKNYYYNLDTNENIYFTIANFGLSAYRQGRSFYNYLGRVNYIYRDMNTQPANRLDAYRFAGGIFLKAYKLVNFQFLLEAERFRIEARGLDKQNKGYRIGPEINISHQSTLLIRGTLKYLWHDSDLHKRSGNELQSQLIIGKFLTPKWSLFAYLDYRIVDIPGEKIPEELLYASINNENWYYLKLEFEPVRKFTVYAKAGYFRDLLEENRNSLSGIQGLIGISWKTP